MQAPARIVPFVIRPATVVCVDDDLKYLKALSIYLTELGISHLMFDSSEKAIKYLEKISKEQDWLRSWVIDSDVEDAVMGTFTAPKLMLPIKPLIEQIRNDNRFYEVSCACFDHKMPVMTGLEAIELLKNRRYKTAMLTGQMPPDDAIENLNEKIIDVYVSKHQPQAIKRIAELIERARQVYFKNGLDYIVSKNGRLSKVLFDKNFNAFYDKFSEDNDYCESYMIDDFCSLALFDKYMKATILAVLHDEEFDAYYETASMADQKPDKDILNLIKERKAFPFFYGHDIANIEPKAWGSYLVPANKVEGSEIFYSVLDDVKKYGIETEGLTSYADFLAKQDPFEFT